MKLPLKGARVAVQGFGNVGSVSADLMARVTGPRSWPPSDVSGAIHNPAGLDVPALLRYVADQPRRRRASRAPSRSPRRSSSTTATSWCRPRSRTRSPARTPAASRPRIVAEGANGPTTPDADKILETKGMLVIPDILCNCRRRDRELLRVGAEPDGLLLAGGRGQRRGFEQRWCRRSATCSRKVASSTEGEHCASRRSWWRSSACVKVHHAARRVRLTGRSRRSPGGTRSRGTGSRAVRSSAVREGNRRPPGAVGLERGVSGRSRTCRRRSPSMGRHATSMPRRPRSPVLSCAPAPSAHPV